MPDVLSVGDAGGQSPGKSRVKDNALASLDQAAEEAGGSTGHPGKGLELAGAAH